jgi:copper chaperone CopZ
MATETIRLPVRGMSCGNCARGIQQTLSRTPGVAHAAVDHAAASAQIEYDPQRVKPEQLAAAIRELGYEVPV